MPLTDRAVEEALALPPREVLELRAAELGNPLLPNVPIDFSRGISPDQAAVLAVLLNPNVRAQRDRLNLSRAQLLQAGILPNPTLDVSVDPVTGGNTLGAVTAYNVGVSWEITSLITHDARVKAAEAGNQSVRLDVAWQEWQFALAARGAVYDLLTLEAELREANEADRLLAENLERIGRAVDQHEKTLLDLSAAESASGQAHAAALGLAKDVRHQRLTLLQAIGLPPDTPVAIAPDVRLPTRLELPNAAVLQSMLGRRRLDLLALRRGYESQDQTVRASVLAQFPKITFGVHQTSDNTNVHSTGVGLTIDLPIFDRQQGTISVESATRQKLFDEYAARIFDSRAQIVSAISDIDALNRQISETQRTLPALGRLVDAYKHAVDRHNADVLSYYTALNELAQKRIDLLKLQQALAQTQLALDIVAGAPLSYAPAPASSSQPSALPSGPSGPNADLIRQGTNDDARDLGGRIPSTTEPTR